MKKRMLMMAMLVALVCSMAFVPVRSAAAQTGLFEGIPVTGTIENGGTFVGTLDVERFAVQGGELVAIGSLTGTLTDALGVIIGTVTNEPVTMPVDIAQATCEILDLELGPLDLDLLGLVVHLDRVNLEITAEQGPGNLLGNLLCGIAGLLDSSASLNAIARALNNLLRLFG